MVNLRHAAIVGLLAVGVIGCGPAITPEPTPSPTSAPSASGGFPLGSGGAVPELEALIPDHIGGQTMSKLSFTGSTLALLGASYPTAEAFLTELGVPASSIDMAIGIVFGTGSSVGTTMTVFRAAGASRDRLLSVFQSAQNASGQSPLAWASQTVGGKQVSVATQPGEGGLSLYVYATDDLLIALAVDDPAAAETVMAGLP